MEGSRARRLSARPQLGARPLFPGREREPLKQLKRGSHVGASAYATPLAPQPFPVQELVSGPLEWRQGLGELDRSYEVRLGTGFCRERMAAGEQ